MPKKAKARTKPLVLLERRFNQHRSCRVVACLPGPPIEVPSYTVMSSTRYAPIYEMFSPAILEDPPDQSPSLYSLGAPWCASVRLVARSRTGETTEQPNSGCLGS